MTDSDRATAPGGERAGVRCELCGVVRMNAMESRDGVVRCQDWNICEQVVALADGARSTYDDLIEAGWTPTPSPGPSQSETPRMKFGHAFKPTKFGSGCGAQLARYPCPYTEAEHGPAPSQSVAAEVGSLDWALAYARRYWQHGQEPESQAALTVLAQAVEASAQREREAARKALLDALVSQMGIERVRLAIPFIEERR